MIFNDELKLVITMPLSETARTVTLFNDNINTLTISQQAMSSGFQLGGVNTATLSATIRMVEGITESAMYAAVIKVFKLINGQWISQGVFNVTSAKGYHNMLTISASDNLIYTNKDSFIVTDNNKKVSAIADWLTTRRYLYDVMYYVVTVQCGLELAQSRAEFEAIPNGDIDTIVFDEVKVDCPRDWLAWIAQTLGGFAYCDGDGKVAIRRFEKEPTETISLSEIQNDSLSLADYEAVACGIRMSEVWDGSFGQVWYVGRDDKPYSVFIEVDDNWIIQGKHYLHNNPDEEYAMDVLRGIYSAIWNLHYRPFSAIVHSDKQFYIGQCVEIENLDGERVSTVISKRTYTLNGGQKLESTGIDTRVLSENAQRTEAQRKAEKLRTEIERAKGKSVTESQLQEIISSKKYREGDVFYVYDTDSDN